MYWGDNKNGLYEMINEWDIVAAYIHLSWPFLSTNFLFEQQFRHNTMDLYQAQQLILVKVSWAVDEPLALYGDPLCD